MHGRRLVLGLLMILILAGCAVGSKPSGLTPAALPEPPGSPAPQSPAQQEPAPQSPAQQEPPPQSPAPRPPTQQTPAPQPPGHLDALLTTADPGALEHHQFNPGEPIGRTGIFIMEIATGKVEGWRVPDDPYGLARYNLSPDNRWVVAMAEQQNYLLNRLTGELYQWPAEQVRLLAARGDLLALEASGRIWVGRPGKWRPVGPDLVPAHPRALIAPDAGSMLLANGQELYLVRPETGAAQPLGKLLPDQPADNIEVRLATALQGKEALVAATANPWGPPQKQLTQVRRYSWQGELQAEWTAPGWGDLSPDGSLFSWVEYVGLGSAVVVAGVPDLQPRFRVKGADTCTEEAVPGSRWLADSSGLVVRVQGGHRVLTPDGRLLELPALSDTDSLREPMPAPDRADRFAIGRLTVVDASGRQLAAAVPRGEGQWFGPGHLSPWGDTSDELRFTLVSGGHGPRCGPLPLPPQPEQPPFASRAILEVSLPPGECLNLRMQYGLNEPVVTCLPGGTQLTPSPSPGRVNKGFIESLPTLMENDGRTWLHVRTAGGERGWVAFSGEYLTWAPPGPEPAWLPDSLSLRIEELAAATDYWLRVALGQAPCGAWCHGGGAFAEVVMGLYHQAREARPANLRNAPGYDPARHEAGIKALEQAQGIILAAWERLGQPPVDSTPGWERELAAARQALAPALPDRRRSTKV